VDGGKWVTGVLPAICNWLTIVSPSALSALPEAGWRATRSAGPAAVNSGGNPVHRGVRWMPRRLAVLAGSAWRERLNIRGELGAAGPGWQGRPVRSAR